MQEDKGTPVALDAVVDPDAAMICVRQGSPSRVDRKLGLLRRSRSASQGVEWTKAGE